MCFVHTNVLPPIYSKIMFALANCFKGEYEETLCSTKLEIQRNEKKGDQIGSLIHLSHTEGVTQSDDSAQQWYINNGINFDFERLIHDEGFLVVGYSGITEALH